ncbi:MAG: transposase [Streptosporangiaceae bacterium]
MLAGWLVIDLDGTLITARSDKEGAAPTFKRGYGFHPLGAWLANTAESLAMLLRPGNAGSNTFADHLTVAIRQIPFRMRSRLLVRVDGAGASHELIAHLLSLSSRCRTVLFTSGWAITAADEQAIALLPAAAWQAAVDQDGVVQEDRHVAEITHLLSRAAGWPAGLRWIVRRTRPSRRQARNLTAFERATGWRYSVIVTNIPPAGGIGGVPGSHHAQFIDVLHRQRAVVEDGVRAGKSMGLRNLPSKTWAVNCGWVLAAGLAAWCRLLGLYDQEDLKDAEPDTLRYRLLSLPARLVRHARQRVLKISRTRPWKDAFLACWRRLCALPAPT